MSEIHLDEVRRVETQHTIFQSEIDSVASQNIRDRAVDALVLFENDFDRLMRRGAQLSVLVGSILFGMAFLYGAYQTMNHEVWIVQLAQRHFAATVGLPFAALAALCLVVILEINAGKVQMKGLGFEFRGATGPIIMWMACFLVITAAIRMVWALD